MGKGRGLRFDKAKGARAKAQEPLCGPFRSVRSVSMTAATGTAHRPGVVRANQPQGDTDTTSSQGQSDFAWSNADVTICKVQWSMGSGQSVTSHEQWAVSSKAQHWAQSNPIGDLGWPNRDIERCLWWYACPSALRANTQRHLIVAAQSRCRPGWVGPP